MDWIAIVSCIFGAGGIASVVTALVSRKKNNAEAEATHIRSILEIDERIYDRLTKLEERVATLERENFELKQRELQLTHENATYLEKIKDLKEENASLHEENEILKEANYELLERLEQYE